MNSKLKITKTPTVRIWIFVLLMCSMFVIRIFFADTVHKQHSRYYLKLPYTLMYGLVSFLVNLLTLLCTGGFKRTCNLVLIYPQVILCSAFTPFMFRYTSYNSLDASYHRNNVGDAENAHLKTENNYNNQGGYHIWIFGTLLNAGYMIFSTYILSCIPNEFDMVQNIVSWSLVFSPIIAISFIMCCLYGCQDSPYRCCGKYCGKSLEPQILNVSQKGNRNLPNHIYGI